jgi:site-specific DNA recombinase
VVLEKLAETDIRARLADAPGVDIDELRTRRAALTARADELARMFASGAIDGGQLGSGTANLRAQIADIDRVLASLAASSPALVLLDGDPDADELVNRWMAAPADIKGKIVDRLFAVTVRPALRGRNRFNPDDIEIIAKV